MLSNAENSASKHWLLSSLFWLVTGMAFGLIVATKQIWPDFLNFQYMTYGRVRPLHVMIVVFAWMTMGFIGAMFYMVPKLTRAKLWSERQGNLAAIYWNLLMVTVVVAFLGFGDVKPLEYAQFPTWIVILSVIGMVLVALNVFKTIQNRKEKQLYVSLWYFMGSLLWLPAITLIGNWPWASGANQANMAWFLGHSAIGLWLTTVGVGQIYFLLPKLANRPLYSHELSLIGFWTIATFYVWNGPHHLMNGPLPGWLNKAGIIPSLLLIIPVWAVLANVFGTMKGAWHKVGDNIPLRFVLTGAILYLMACLQGPFQSLPSVNSVIKFTHWTVGHAHVGPIGFSIVTMATIYYVIPRITGKQIFSRGMMEAHYFLTVVGFLIFAFALWVAGIIQGFEWIKGTAFIETVDMVRPYVAARGIGGLMMILGQIIFAINIFMTLSKGEKVEKGGIIKSEEVA